MEQVSRDPPHFARQAFVGRCDQDVSIKAVPSKGEGDWQAMANLMNLIVVEQESYAHLCLTARCEPHLSRKNRQIKNSLIPAGSRLSGFVTDNLWSPHAGLIFKPVESASIYASYSRTYQPRGGDQLTGLSLSNASLAPEKFQNYEIGAKWDIVPSFNVSAAIFQLDRDNVLALQDPNNASSPTVPIGRQRTKGVELSLAGSITKQLSMVDAYTYSDGTFLDNISGNGGTVTVRAGNQLPNIPKHAASLWTRFDPIEQLGIGAGVIYQGKCYAATDNQVAMPGYTRVDGALYYTVAPEFSLQVNVENIFGKPARRKMPPVEPVCLLPIHSGSAASLRRKRLMTCAWMESFCGRCHRGGFPGRLS